MSLTTNAQDVIVKKDGSTILAKVQRVTTTQVKFSDYSDPNGMIHTISVTELLAINYEDGEKETFTSVTNTDATSTEHANSNKSIITQETVTQFSNDNQLLNIYKQKTKLDSKLKLRWVL